MDTEVRTARLVSAEVAAELCGISLRAWRRLDAAGRVPRPVTLGSRLKRWREDELKDWIDAGCPSRRSWESRKEKD
jgi:predicted DNA-binding transcriptional regulator AlpA